MNKRYLIIFCVCLALVPLFLSLALPSSKIPLTTGHFLVEWGGTSMEFHSVEGLEARADILEYRDGISPVYSPQKIPGQLHYSNIILRRYYKKADNDMWKWFNTKKGNTIERKAMRISILDEQHQPVVIFNIFNAWPCAYRGPCLTATSDDLAIEELEIAYDSFTVENN